MATVLRPGAAAGGVPALPRPRLFSGLVALAALNAFAGVAVHTLLEHGLAYSLFELFGISAILWFALAACIALLNQAPRAEAIRSSDWWIALAVALVALLPVAVASAFALDLIALYLIATGAPGSAERRAGIIVLAMTGSLIWGRLLLAMFSGPMLAVDSLLVGKLAATVQSANVLALSDGSGRLAIAPGCSSWQGMSLALVFWATVNQWFRVPFGWRSVGWCVAALAATMAINVARISCMILYPAHLAEIHHGIGWHVSMWLTLAAICSLCLYGARREAFAR